MKEFTLTLGQIFSVHYLPEVLKSESRVEVEMLKSVDIAINAEIVGPIVKGYQKMNKPSDKVEQYKREVEKAKLELSGAELNSLIKTLNKEYAEDLAEEKERQKKFLEILDDEKKAVSLNPIPIEAFKGESSTIASIIKSVLPILTRGGKPLIS